MQSEKTNSEVVLLTGASSGIGLALAKRLWNSSYRVVVTARKDSLPKFNEQIFAENERFLIRSLDVTSDEERQSLVRDIEELWGGVDILINNAGVSYRSVIEHITEEDELMQLRTNFHGPMALIRLVLPMMRKKKAGRIINVSSVSGMLAMPTMGIYSASKFALEGATEALWYEARPWNIKVSLIQPGFVNSNSFRRVLWGERAKLSYNKAHGAYTIYYKEMSSFIEQLMHKAFATPLSIADKIIETMQDENPHLRVPATIDACFFSVLRRLLPRRLFHWLLYRNLPGVKQWGKR